MVCEALGQNNVIVVAHPDDETLWCGGLPIRYSNRNWTIIACSIPRLDPARAYQFFDACHWLGATGRLLPFSEGNPGEPLDNIGLLDLTPYDCIVTHGAAGEYGNPQHKAVHEFLVNRWHGHRMITFGYKTGEDSIELEEGEVIRKTKALKCYSALSVGTNMTKWQALIDRYCKDGFRFDVEHYDTRLPNT